MSDLHFRLFTASVNILSRMSSINDGTFFITKNEFEVFNRFGLIVAIEKGGLLKAPQHSEGGIKLLIPNEDCSKYFISAEFEGYEFIMNPNISKQAEKELYQLNESFLPENPNVFNPYEIPPNIAVIDGDIVKIGGGEFPKFLLYSGKPQFIINKFSTMATFQILDELNKTDNSI